MITLFDTHAHLTSEELIPDLPQILIRARAANVRHIVNICTDEKSLKEGLLLQTQEKGVYLAAATTPHDVEREGTTFFPLVEQVAKEGKLIAIGETGLDYFYTHSPVKTQQTFLSSYFALAGSLQLPLIFHCRDAFSDLFIMADQEYKGKPALLHCFTGTLEEAKGVLDRGWLLSVSGIATYKKSEELREVIRYVPLSHLVIETDAPYLAPQSHRGKRNEPAFILETAELIASLKQISLAQAARELTLNALRFFQLPLT